MTTGKGCDQQLLLLYHYHELDAEQMRSVATHLEHCSACRQERDQLAQVLAAIPAPQPERNSARHRLFTEKVMRQRQRSPHRHMGAWGGALAAAGALAIYMVMLQPAPPPPVAPTSAQADIEVLEQLDMLQDLDLLQNLEILQELEGAG